MKLYSFNEILQRMLDRVPSDIDKREGTFIYDALAPAAAELAQMYIELENVTNMSFADTATGDFLTRRTAERGISRSPATKAIRKGIFNIVVPLNSRFSIEGIIYKVIENLSNNESKLECEENGYIGNIYSGTLTPIDFIDGLTTANLTDILIPGEDIEDDVSLRKRYYNSLESESFGGNIADYKVKTNAINGVGGTKPYATWNGGGTVKLVIIDSTFNKPSTVLVNDVQTKIDPTVNQGKGLGIAPVGHVVTVEGVTELIVNVSSNITLVTGYIWDDVLPYINEAINDYFLALKKTWESEENIVVRISQIESYILKVTGVLDITATKLNDSINNLILTDKQIPKLGMVTKL